MRAKLLPLLLAATTLVAIQDDPKKKDVGPVVAPQIAGSTSRQLYLTYKRQVVLYMYLCATVVQNAIRDVIVMQCRSWTCCCHADLQLDMQLCDSHVTTCSLVN